MTELRDIDQSLPLQLLKAREAAMAGFRTMLRQHGLTEQQWRVMRVLHAYPDTDATTLAQRTVLLAPSLTRILRHLQEQDMVQRHTDPVDQRRATFQLTPAGRNKVAEVAPDSERMYSAIESRFGRENLKQMYTLLAQFSEAMHTEPAP